MMAMNFTLSLFDLAIFRVFADNSMKIHLDFLPSESTMKIFMLKFDDLLANEFFRPSF